jgi:hypothetical protein
VNVASNEVLRLPPPTLSGGLNAAEQRARVDAIPEKRCDWGALTRRSVVAPVVLKIGAPESASAAVGRQVDLWFVAYADLDSVGSDDFLGAQFGAVTKDDDAENRPRVKALSDADLNRRGVALAAQSASPYYLAGEFTLLDKVRICGVTRCVKTRLPDSVTVASVLDERFADDSEFPCGARSIMRDAAGKRQLGELRPYAGFASYVRATRLIEPKGAVLIEYHVAFAEPREWFNGANLLRSKLPIAAQEAVRKLRRSLDPKKS